MSNEHQEQQSGRQTCGQTFIGLPKYLGLSPDPPPSQPHGWYSEMAHAFAATLCLGFAGALLCQLSILCTLDLQALSFQDAALDLLKASRYGLLGGGALGLWIDWGRAFSDEVRGRD
jgi:hypothetical protein